MDTGSLRAPVLALVELMEASGAMEAVNPLLVLTMTNAKCTTRTRIITVLKLDLKGLAGLRATEATQRERKTAK